MILKAGNAQELITELGLAFGLRGLDGLLDHLDGFLVFLVEQAGHGELGIGTQDALRFPDVRVAHAAEDTHLRVGLRLVELVVGLKLISHMIHTSIKLAPGLPSA